MKAKANENLLRFFNEFCPELKPSMLFFNEGKMYITKIIDGVAVTKEAIKDLNYSGNRYIWKD